MFHEYPLMEFNTGSSYQKTLTATFIEAKN